MFKMVKKYGSFEVETEEIKLKFDNINELLKVYLIGKSVEVWREFHSYNECPLDKCLKSQTINYGEIEGYIFDGEYYCPAWRCEDGTWADYYSYIYG